MAADLISQLKSLQERVAKLELHERNGWRTALSQMRGWKDEFGGDQLDARWNPTSTGVGSLVPALQATSPSRVLFDTGAVIIGASSQMDEGAFFHWSPAGKITAVSIAKLSTLTNIRGSVLLLRDGPFTSYAEIAFDSNVNATKFFCVCAAGGAGTLSLMQDADTNYHVFELSISTGLVKARIDFGTIAEITTNTPTVDLKLFYQVMNRTAAASKQMELDFSLILPGFNAF